MPLEVSKELRTWLHRHALGGYLRIIDAPPHPEAQEIARWIHPDIVTNNHIRSMLGLDEVENMILRPHPKPFLKNTLGHTQCPVRRIAHMAD